VIPGVSTITSHSQGKKFDRKRIRPRGGSHFDGGRTGGLDEDEKRRGLKVLGVAQGAIWRKEKSNAKKKKKK